MSARRTRMPLVRLAGRDAFPDQDPQPHLHTPTDQKIHEISDFFKKNQIFLAQSRAMNCQIAISGRLGALLRQEMGDEAENLLACVRIIEGT